jgi:hypothetical protein
VESQRREVSILKRAWRAGVLIAILLPLAARAQSPMPQVTITVYNDAHVEENLLTQAQLVATRIFQNAGVHSLWIVYPSKTNLNLPAAESPAQSTQLVLRILPWSSPLGDSVFGSAFLSADGTGTCSDVFFPSVQKLHHDWQASIPRVLGSVMAHEIGHLLLGSNAHSASGIMQPHWQGTELRSIGMGTLLFTPEQAQEMRRKQQPLRTESASTLPRSR